MVRTKTPTAPPELETIVEPPPAERVAKTPTAEPTTVSITAQHLGDVLAGYAFALAALGVDRLSSEGRAAFRDIVADLDNAGGLPPARYEIPAEAAFWIATDLLNNRRRGLTAGEVVLGQTVRQETPELARRLSAKAASRPRRQGGFPVPSAPTESAVLVTDSGSAKYPRGQYYDSFGRSVGPKLAAPSTF